MHVLPRWISEGLLFLLMGVLGIAVIGPSGDLMRFATELALAFSGIMVGLVLAAWAVDAIHNGLPYSLAKLAVVIRIMSRRLVVTIDRVFGRNPFRQLPECDNLTQALGNLELGNRDMALIHLERELAQNPSEANVWVHFASIKKETDPYKALIAVDLALKFDSHHKRFNTNGQIWVKKAEILGQLGKYEAATTLLESNVLPKAPHYRKAHQLHQDFRDRLYGI